jgi:hypothetical protein
MRNSTSERYLFSGGLPKDGTDLDCCRDGINDAENKHINRQRQIDSLDRIRRCVSRERRDGSSIITWGEFRYTNGRDYFERVPIPPNCTLTVYLDAEKQVIKSEFEENPGRILPWEDPASKGAGPAAGK